MNSGSLEKLQTKLRGEVIQPGDPAYDSARKVYNGMIDKRPAVHCPLHRCCRHHGRREIRP